ncbi:protein SSUH2 homolog [Anolis carolinensis]|uniref:protein SSUH2 homolog n=1 Tax=Anolis carolinensis TaxID=28377 RepID=UPI002F2B3DDE
MTQIPGSFAPPLYEDVTSGEVNQFRSHEGEQPTSQRNWSATAISEDVAKEVFAQYAASQCCYSKDPAKEMVISDSKSLNTYRYRLETFSESRTCKWKTVPYRDEPVDPSLRAHAPYPWDVQVEVSPMFKEQKKKVMVPRTSSVKVCGRCHGRGKVTCGHCHGSGRVDSTIGDQQTTSMCSSCGGSGRTRCSTCAGKGKLLTYLQIKIKWKNNIFEYVMDHGSGFPIKHFDKVCGQEMLFDEQRMVSPVRNFSENILNEVSRRAVEQHRAQFITGRQEHHEHGTATWNAIEHPQARFEPTMSIRRQKQTIELLYLTRVEYEWHGKHYSYFVYGNEQKVYSEYYPKRGCCSVM